MDRMDQEEIKKANQLLADCLFRTAAPFRFVEAQEFKEFIRYIRPAYADHLPSGKSVGGVLLKEAYQKLTKRLKLKIKNSINISVCSDGWSNIRSEHIINILVLIPNEKPIFMKSVNTAGMSMTGKNIADIIINALIEIGITKISSVVTDTTANMRAAWDIIEKNTLTSTVTDVPLTL